ncbi:uncharacterized protein LOC143040676 [Oratosquilla oratoria]|uniref:uncharacterized protein LOC143040676 n=1 Tax=Oratosquilla oratoria TaxID=337810 RepID=UPI003F76A83F
MLQKCLFHILDHVVPKTEGLIDVEDQGKELQAIKNDPMKHDLLRLEYLSACRILEDKDTSTRYLPHTPPPLFPALLKTVALKCLNNPDRMPENLPISVIPLVELWPYEELILENHIPSQFRKVRSNKKVISIHDIIIKLYGTFDDLAKYVATSFINERMLITQRSRSHLKKLDLSGFYPQTDGILMLSNVKRAVEINYKPNADDRDQVIAIIDAKVTEKGDNSFKHLCVICELSTHHGAGLVINFRSVHCSSIPQKQICVILHHLAKNKVESLEIEMCSLDTNISKFFSPLAPTLKALNLEYNPALSSIEFLQEFRLLTQLNLSGIKLSGKLKVLEKLPQGLEYLRLVGCSIKAEDLHVIAKSHHKLSLKHLDIGENNFGNNLECSALAGLCRVLCKAAVLELENCGLQRAETILFADFIDSLCQIPLTLLNLSRNDFSERVFKGAIVNLGACDSLRVLLVTVPSIMYISDNYSVNNERLMNLQNYMEKHLNIDRFHACHIDWKEEITYSRWFYSIEED